MSTGMALIAVVAFAQTVYADAVDKELAKAAQTAHVPGVSIAVVKHGKTLHRGFYVAPYMHARADVGLLSTARDLALWAIALDAGKVIKDPKRLWTSFRTDDGKRDLAYAYGWSTHLLNGHRVVEHSGGFRTGFHSRLVRFIDDDVTITVADNCTGCADPFVLALARAYVAGFVDPRTRDAKDADPSSTQTLITAVRAAGEGKLDPDVFATDAIFDQDGMRDFMKQVDKITFVSRRKLKLIWNGGDIVEIVTLQLSGRESMAISLYRDASGKVLRAEPIE